MGSCGRRHFPLDFHPMRDSIAADWKSTLEASGLADFDALWKLETDWFEPPNQRRGGWSGVARFALDRPDGSRASFFLKRQQNHLHRDLLHPLGEPTFAREWRNIRRYRQSGIPTLEPVYYGERRLEGQRRAILITAALEGYRSLQEILADWRLYGQPPLPERYTLLRAVAHLVRAMHARHLQHNSLYPKHLFLKADGHRWLARVIDLEKSKRRWRRQDCQVRDLSTLTRYAEGLSHGDRLRFYLLYRGEFSLTPKGKGLLRLVLRDVEKKRGG